MISTPWNKDRDFITRLYMQGGRSLENARDIMRNDHGLQASIRALRQRFERWGFPKWEINSSVTREPQRSQQSGQRLANVHSHPGTRQPLERPQQQKSQTEVEDHSQPSFRNADPSGLIQDRSDNEADRMEIPDTKHIPVPFKTQTETDGASCKRVHDELDPSQGLSRGYKDKQRSDEHQTMGLLSPTSWMLQKSSDKRRNSASLSQGGPNLTISKSQYVRPRHLKLYCTKCNERPDGFRGEHELQRHMTARHEEFVKRFVCRDPADIGVVSKVQPIIPLNKCKHCLASKEYVAYYNAAAHLRRRHFNPKIPGDKSKGNNEMRGEKGVYDYPPMSELKLWFKETLVKVDHPQDDGISGDMDKYERMDEGGTSDMK